MPQSDVIVCSTPNRAIQVEHSASAQAESVMEDRGMASAHRVLRSMLVNMYVKPCEGGSEPTMST